MMKLFKRRENKQQRELKREVYKQQQQAYKVIIEKTHSVNYAYWQSLIASCRVERDSSLMELLDFYCINYNLLKGGR